MNRDSVTVFVNECVHLGKLLHVCLGNHMVYDIIEFPFFPFAEIFASQRSE